jgi:hypothetical protein
MDVKITGAQGFDDARVGIHADNFESVRGEG